MRQEIEEYIKERRKEGYNDEQIKQKFVENGYDPIVVESFFEKEAEQSLPPLEEKKDEMVMEEKSPKKEKKKKEKKPKKEKPKKEKKAKAVKEPKKEKPKKEPKKEEKKEEPPKPKDVIPKKEELPLPDKPLSHHNKPPAWLGIVIGLAFIATVLALLWQLGVFG